MAIETPIPASVTLGNLIDRLVAALQPNAIYLFGSRARGEAREDSDYDVLVVVEQSDLPPSGRATRAYEALWGLGVPVDVIVLTRGEFERMARDVTSLPATVLREGIRVHAA